MRSRTRRAFLLTATALATAVAVGLAGEDVPAPRADDRFVVHEWGTFTSVQGQDGVALEGLAREEETLPEFVCSRSKIRACPLREKGWKGLEVPADHVTQKMETPVLYFRSATSRKARVRVDFVQGLISQWYPVSDLLGPPEKTADEGPLDLAKVDRSFVQWDVEVLPTGAPRPDEVPSVDAKDPWSFAREVDASWVRTLPRKGADRAGPVEAERYLFYRGLGRFTTPLSATAGPGATFVLANRGDVAIESPIVMEVKGDKARMTEVDAIAAGGERKAQLQGGAWWGPLDDVVEKLQALLQSRLRGAGLAGDEARAMVRTWSRSWFRCEGTRVLWIVPRPRVDALLPLSIDPAPDELVRVLVGRLEVITPEVEAEDYEAILDNSRGGAEPTKGLATLRTRGRFLEPHLRNVVASIDRRAREGRPLEHDEEVGGEARSWLSKFRNSGEIFNR
jgi:hypothetical protein